MFNLNIKGVNIKDRDFMLFVVLLVVLLIVSRREAVKDKVEKVYEQVKSQWMNWIGM